MSEPIKKFYRSRTDRVIWGVCGGLGEYFKVDPTLIRILFVLLSFGSGVGIILYIILALISPNNPKDKMEGSEKVKELAKELGISAKKISNEISQKNNHHVRNVLGLAVLTIGIAMLLKPIFHFYLNWEVVLPFLVILLGFYLLSNFNKHK